MKNNIVAIMYDFDKTLTVKDTLEYSFIPNLDLDINDFWSETDKLRAENKTDQILGYMYMMRKKMLEKDMKLSREYLNDMGKEIKLFPGVLEWFDRINEYGRSLGLEIEHYVISAGLKEIIEGSSIGDKFKCVFASEYLYDEDGNAVWPNISINSTNKTQFLTRINKGVLDVTDDRFNEKMLSENRRVLSSNMIYFGDGFTDIPCMQITKDRGGVSIAVYTGDNYNTAKKLYNDGRLNYVAKADYSLDGQIDTIIRTELKLMAIKNNLLEDEKIM